MKVIVIAVLACVSPFAEAAPRVDFQRDVRPIFERTCYRCHGPGQQQSGFRLDRKSAALTGGEIGRAIVPGRSGESPLLRYVEGIDANLVMPPMGPRLTADQIGVLRRWIDDGAEWPDDVATGPDPRLDWWSLRPVARSTTPRFSGPSAEWLRTPVDAFVLERLQAKGLAPSPAADQRMLLRRLYFDLLGLPPSPDEIENFLADAGPDAYERLVDRLLASPRYGERWARHWMDLVHFAETHGHDQDRIRPNAWPYRDYLIAAFNADRPYARFVEEQIAADALFPGEPNLVAALGLIAAGPWDESSLQSIRDDTLDRQIALYIDRDDMLATTMSTFASTTVHCARCHDHKFDPISQRDYYRLQAVFAGVGRAERPFDPDPQTNQRRQELRKQLAALDQRAPQLFTALIEPGAQAELAEWERVRSAEAKAWSVLDPFTSVSAQGSTLTKQPDGSILATGSRPAKDTYTIAARTDLRGITAVRLEVLTDESLPHKGPGRQDNGNLHLSEFRLLARAVSAQPDTQPDSAKAVALQTPSADFNQDGWTIQHALDGNLATAWGIYPQVGKSHQATFQLREPLHHDGGTELKFELDQQHGGGHLLGRVRLSVTNVSPPVQVASLPAGLAALLAVPREQRSPAQQSEVAAIFLKEKLERELAALPAQPFVFAAASMSPRPVHVLRRGEVTKPGELVSPGSLSCVAALSASFELPPEHHESTGRAALAKWLADPRNPLTWRSIVNRVWHHHFGRGLVDTPNDFGRMGSLPSHPELLDWLTADFLNSDVADGGGSIKRLHRQLVTSAVYRQSSAHSAAAATLDADNRLLWRMNRARLDAETVRDAIVHISGRLELTMGGPSVRQFSLKPGIHVTPLINYGEFDWNGPGANRRSVYRFIFRTLPDPFMDAFDCPDASQLTAVRNVSISPLQALSMLNNEFMLTHSEHFARRLESVGSPGDRVTTAFTLCFSRPPSAEERQACETFATQHGWAGLCRLLLNSNEFLFVE